MVCQVRIKPALFVIVATTVCVLAAPSSSGDGGDQTEIRGSNSGDARTQGSAPASTRLMKELMETYKSDSYKRGIFQVELVNDNLYEWEVKLFISDPKSPVRKGLDRLKQQGKRDHIVLRITFSANYPNEAPFVRHVYPIFWNRNTGAVCMYLLSPHGWIPDCTMESLILTVMDHLIHNKQIVNVEASDSEYSGEGSVEEHKKYVASHGWDYPRPKNQAWYEEPEASTPMY